MVQTSAHFLALISGGALRTAGSGDVSPLGEAGALFENTAIDSRGVSGLGSGENRASFAQILSLDSTVSSVIEDKVDGAQKVDSPVENGIENSAFIGALLSTQVNTTEPAINRGQTLGIKQAANLPVHMAGQWANVDVNLLQNNQNTSSVVNDISLLSPVNTGANGLMPANALADDGAQLVLHHSVTGAAPIGFKSVQNGFKTDANVMQKRRDVVGRSLSLTSLANNGLKSPLAEGTPKMAPSTNVQNITQSAVDDGGRLPANAVAVPKSTATLQNVLVSKTGYGASVISSGQDELVAFAQEAGSTILPRALPKMPARPEMPVLPHHGLKEIHAHGALQSMFDVDGLLQSGRAEKPGSLEVSKANDAVETVPRGNSSLIMNESHRMQGIALEMSGVHAQTGKVDHSFSRELDWRVSLPVQGNSLPSLLEQGKMTQSPQANQSRMGQVSDVANALEVNGGNGAVHGQRVNGQRSLSELLAIPEVAKVRAKTEPLVEVDRQQLGEGIKTGADKPLLSSRSPRFAGESAFLATHIKAHASQQRPDAQGVIEASQDSVVLQGAKSHLAQESQQLVKQTAQPNTPVPAALMHGNAPDSLDAGEDSAVMQRQLSGQGESGGNSDAKTGQGNAASSRQQAGGLATSMIAGQASGLLQAHSPLLDVRDGDAFFEGEFSGDFAGRGVTGLHGHGQSGHGTVGAQMAQVAAERQISQVVWPEFTRQLQRKASSFEIKLHPAELGSVNVSLEFTKDGRVKAHMFVERSETLDFLMRDQRALAKALQDAGYGQGQTELQFSLGQGQGERQNAFAQSQSEHGQTDFSSQGGRRAVIEKDEVARSLPRESNLQSGLNRLV
ncbi:flagellar hook-length control protein FliK [Polycladidibacter stylochi]|uniref:flagellar hook-length control protein FliK n=1 Tax=Polycladidibacter stylochi TaxID=1807766 RepID=UPI00082FA1C7|nr:flagellar hook-length control protein FliK [Pseudovibrio stylochi]